MLTSHREKCGRGRDRGRGRGRGTHLLEGGLQQAEVVRVVAVPAGLGQGGHEGSHALHARPLLAQLRHKVHRSGAGGGGGGGGLL